MANGGRSRASPCTRSFPCGPRTPVIRADTSCRAYCSHARVLTYFVFNRGTTTNYCSAAILQTDGVFLEPPADTISLQLYTRLLVHLCVRKTVVNLTFKWYVTRVAGVLGKRVNAIFMSVDYANGGGGGQPPIDTDEQLRLVRDWLQLSGVTVACVSVSMRSRTRRTHRSTITRRQQ